MKTGGLNDNGLMLSTYPTYLVFNKRRTFTLNKQLILLRMQTARQTTHAVQYMRRSVQLNSTASKRTALHGPACRTNSRRCPALEMRRL